MDHIAERLFGPVAGDVMAVLAIVSIAASVSAMTIAGPRVYFAMARDRVFFRRAAVIHPVYGTPAAAIVAQALWSAVLVLTGSFSSCSPTRALRSCSSRGSRAWRCSCCAGGVPTSAARFARGAIR